MNCWTNKVEKVVVVFGLDHHFCGTLLGSYTDDLGVAWGVMGPDTIQWGDDAETGPTEISKIGSQDVPQTAVKAIALAESRWPEWKLS